MEYFLWEYVARYYAIADYGTTQQSVDMRWLTETSIKVVLRVFICLLKPQ
jgi:hypothetical protein